MKRVFYLGLLSFSFSQVLDLRNDAISKLELAVENASRLGQVVWAEEFSGLS